MNSSDTTCVPFTGLAIRRRNYADPTQFGSFICWTDDFDSRTKVHPYVVLPGLRVCLFGDESDARQFERAWNEEYTRVTGDNRMSAIFYPIQETNER